MKYLKTWEAINNEVKVKIVTPKVAEDRQNIFWYHDGNHLAVVSDNFHEFTIYIDVIGSGPTEEELKSNMTDKDIGEDEIDGFFRIEFYVAADPNDMSAGSQNLVIAEEKYYDKAIETAKKGLSDPDILQDIVDTNSCNCDKCEQVRKQLRFDL